MRLRAIASRSTMSRGGPSCKPSASTRNPGEPHPLGDPHRRHVPARLCDHLRASLIFEAFRRQRPARAHHGARLRRPAVAARPWATLSARCRGSGSPTSCQPATHLARHRARRQSPARPSRASTICSRICASRAACHAAARDHGGRRAQRLRERPQRGANTPSPSRAACSTRSSDAELEAVLAHELTHIRNGDVRLMVIAGVMAGIVLVLRRDDLPLVDRRPHPLARRAAAPTPSSPRAATTRGAAAPSSAIVIGVVSSPWRGSCPSTSSSRCRGARISRRCGRRRAHQESRRHDLGAAEDRRPRRARRTRPPA